MSSDTFCIDDLHRTMVCIKSKIVSAKKRVFCKNDHLLAYNHTQCIALAKMSATDDNNG